MKRIRLAVVIAHGPALHWRTGRRRVGAHLVENADLLENGIELGPETFDLFRGKDEARLVCKPQHVRFREVQSELLLQIGIAYHDLLST